MRGFLARITKGGKKDKRKSTRMIPEVSRSEGASSTSAIPQSPRVVVGGSHDLEDHGADFEMREAGQKDLRPDVEVAVQSGPSREGGGVDGKNPNRPVDPPHPPLSAPSIPHRGEPNNNVDNSAIPDHLQEALGPDQNEPETIGEKESRWKSTAPAAAKLLLRGVRDSADAFGPLKSVAGFLCYILENCERTKANEQAIESLAPRIDALSALLCAPVSGDYTKEQLRRGVLERQLKKILRELGPLIDQGYVKDFVENVKNADKLGDLVEDIRDAMMEYQTSLQQDIYERNRRLIESEDLAILDGMHHTANAGYLSGDRQGCLRGTRTNVLWQIEHWLTHEHRQRVFWLNGLAGTGKSTIAQSFAETSFASDKLGASFFCSRDFEDRSGIRAIFPTLAFQLAYRYPQFRRELLPILRASRDFGRESLYSQVENLLVGPLKAARISTLIIIDALDECKDEEPASAILSVLSRFVDQIPGVKFFVTGRPEPRIRTGFRLELLRPITDVLKLHEVEPRSVDDDIKLFFRVKLGEIAKNRSDCDLTENWPSPYEIDILCKKAAGLFIYASTVVKFIASPSHLYTERLTLIISLPNSTIHEGKSGIDILYTQVLEQAFHGMDSDGQELYSRFKLVVGAVLLVFHPLSRKTLSELVKKCGTPPQISDALQSLHSLLLIPESEAEPIRIFHESFPRFLTDPGRCKDQRFFIDPPVHHIDILFSCLRLMEEKLKKNICGLDGCPTLSEVKDLPTRREIRIGGALEYACRFWTKHLAKIPGNGTHVKLVQETIDEFFTKRLLFWIEVLSLTRNLNVGVYALDEINQWYLSAGVSCKWTNESQRLILLNFDVIRDSPTNIYHDAVPFSPSSSSLHKWYTAASLQTVEVVKGRPDKWGTCSRVVTFDHFPEVLACHKDIVIVGLSSGDIIALDAITGTRGSVFSGHTDGVASLVFSLDGKLLVSGSKDYTVSLWNIQTGGAIKTFRSAAHRPCSVSISPDSITIASGSHNNAICLWDIRTGECRHIIEQCFMGQKGRAVTSVCFVSETPSRLMAASEAGFVQQFDVVDGSEIGDLIHGDHVAFSSDGSRFVSSQGRSPVVRNSGSRAIIAFLPSVIHDLDRYCFSASGQFVVGVSKGTAYVWDITNSAHLVETIVLPDTNISSVVFSESSLISASRDKSVRFCQVDGSSSNQATMKTRSTTLASTAITSIVLQAEERTAITIDSDGEVVLWALPTGLCKVSFQAFEADGGHASDARVVQGELVVAFYGRDSTWKISTWDVGKEEYLKTVDLPPEAHVRDHNLRISGDGTRAFGLGEQCIRTWSTSDGKSTGDISFEWPSHSSSPPFVVDDSRLWIRSGDSPAQGWDLRNPGSPPLPSSDMPLDGRRLDFIQVDDISGPNTGPTRIEDTITRKEVFRLPERFGQPSVAQWDGRYLVAVYSGTGELLILDFHHMIPR